MHRPKAPSNRFFYAGSVLRCLPVGMADSPSAGSGALMRPAMLQSYAEHAGFSAVDILPIEHDMLRFHSSSARDTFGLARS